MASLNDRAQELLVWTQIRNLLKLRVVQQMYVWLVSVPILARGLANVPEEATFNIYGQKMTIALGLPISWKLFYFSFVCILLSNAIYQVLCPRLIKDNPNFTSFLQARKGFSHLARYNDTLGNPIKLRRILDRHFEYLQNSTDFRQSFWNLHAHANSTNTL